MAQHPNPLIERMATDLQPVRTLKFRDGFALVCVAALLTVLAVEMIHGLWRGVLIGQASAFFVLTNGLLLVLGIASTHSVINMANPRVGANYDGPQWAMAMAAVLPAAALFTVVSDQSIPALINDLGVGCFKAALLTSALIAGAMVFWLRRGAPVSPARAGLHLGVASTALGSVAYGLACPLDGVVHLGIWHVMPVIVGGLLGRFLLPPVLRW
ncbi:MAG: DUF1109 domain-containing protein [Congregibacter sp.]|nr:DUF1109 domain-containing protein [Congregibacter sp.]